MWTCHHGPANPEPGIIESIPAGREPPKWLSQRSFPKCRYSVTHRACCETKPRFCNHRLPVCRRGHSPPSTHRSNTHQEYCIHIVDMVRLSTYSSMWLAKPRATSTTNKTPERFLVCQYRRHDPGRHLCMNTRTWFSSYSQFCFPAMYYY